MWVQTSHWLSLGKPWEGLQGQQEPKMSKHQKMQSKMPRLIQEWSLCYWGTDRLREEWRLQPSGRWGNRPQGSYRVSVRGSRGVYKPAAELRHQVLQPQCPLPFSLLFWTVYLGSTMTVSPGLQLKREIVPVIWLPTNNTVSQEHSSDHLGLLGSSCCCSLSHVWPFATPWTASH